MTAYPIPNPFSVFTDTTGPLTGAYVYIGVAGDDPETNPIPVYQDAALSVPFAQPLRTLGGYLVGTGTPANAYPSTTPYSIRVRRQQGASPGTEVFYLPVVHDEIADALAALLASLNAANVVYTGGASGAVAHTVQSRLRERVSLLDFYTATDPDLTNAATKAATYANGAGGHVGIMVPQVNDFINGPVVLTQDHIAFIGDSNSSSIIKTSYNGPLFTFRGYAGGLENLQFTYPSAPPANAVVMLQDGATGQNIKNCRINNVRTFVQIGTSTTSGGALTVSGLNGNIYNGGSPLFNLYAGAGLFVINAGVYVNGVGVPVTDRVSTMTTVAGTSFIKTNNKTFDTIVIGSGCILERWWRILDFVTAGTGDLILNVFVDTATIIVDYCRDDVYHLESVLGSGGIINAVVGGYANSWEGRSVNIIGNSNARAIDIVGLNCAVNGYEAVKISGPNPTRIRMDRPRSVAANRLNTGVSDINITTGDHIELIGGIIGENGTFGGSPWQGTYGLSVAADLSFITIADNDSDGSTGPYNFADNTTASGNRRIRDNVNATYAGLKTTGVYVLPASGVGWQNKSGFEVEVTIGGGTVTQIFRNSVLTGLIAGTITILPGDTFSITYSVAPTIQFYIKP